MAIDWAAIKEIAVAAAALITAGVAVAGFNKWRSELAGKAHFDCARTVARCVYQLRRTVRDCRSIGITQGEFPPGYDSFNATAQQKADGYAHVYGARFGKVGSALTELDTAALEVEALWGQEIERRIEALRACVYELNAALYAYIDNARQGGTTFQADRTFGDKIEKMVWAKGDETSNRFTERLTASVKAIEAELRPHLGRAA